MAASAYHVISTEVENHIFKPIEFFDTSAFINNQHWQRSGILIFLCNYCIVISETLVGFLGCALFVAPCNTIRTSWETNKEILSYRQTYIEEFALGISLFWMHALLSMSFCCFLRLLPPFSQVMPLQNDPYKDTHIAMGGILCDDISKRSKIWKSLI